MAVFNNKWNLQNNIKTLYETDTTMEKKNTSYNLNVKNIIQQRINNIVQQRQNNIVQQRPKHHVYLLLQDLHNRTLKETYDSEEEPSLKNFL